MWWGLVDLACLQAKDERRWESLIFPFPIAQLHPQLRASLSPSHWRPGSSSQSLFAEEPVHDYVKDYAEKSQYIGDI